MKTSNAFYLLLGLLLTLSACDKEDTSVPIDFSGTVNGIYYEGQQFTFLEKDGDKWIEVKEDPILPGFKFYSSSLWFDSGALTASAIIPFDTEWIQYLDQTGKEIDLYIRSPFKYDTATGKLSTDRQILDSENEGNSFFVEKATDRQLTLRVECAQAIGDLWGYRIIYQAVTPPNTHKEYEVFDSNEEVKDYIIALIGKENL